MIHTISIKELTKQTGLTVRTLRYYDQINLLKPSAKTDGGHRLYAEEELMKLQQIQFLKTMGFSLQEIKDMLTNPKWDWSTSLNNQLSYVQSEQIKLKQMEATLLGLLNSMAVQGEMRLHDIQKLIELSGQDPKLKQKIRKNLFHDEEKLFKRLPNMNRDDPDSMEWIALLGQLQKYRQDGPDSPQVQRIIARMQEKTEELFANEERFLDKIWEVRKSSVQSQQIGLYPLEPELITFIEQAYEIYLSQTEHHLNQEGES